VYDIDLQNFTEIETMSTKIDVVYDGDLRCQVLHASSGKTFVTDVPEDLGGGNTSFSPTDLVAAGVVSCILTTMVIVARRRGIDLSGLKAQATKEMISEPVRRIGTIKVSILMPAGINLAVQERQKIENAANLCPAKRSLLPEVNVALEFIYH
jgi:putative redox protein